MAETVVIIEEDGHGLLGVAKDYKSAINFLIENDWLTRYTDVYDWDREEYIEVEGVLGPNWKNIILNEMDINAFVKLFDSVFYLAEKEVYMKNEI